MSLRPGAIHRSLSTMAIEVGRSMERKRKAAEAEALREVDQQFQIDISGVGGTLEWVTVELSFEEIFYDAPAQRDADLDEPHFTSGVVITSGQPVMISAHVCTWRVDENDNFTGAVVRIGCFDPTMSAQPFTGRLHANFQGFAAPSDPDEDN